MTEPAPYVAPVAGPKQALSLTSFILGIAAFLFGLVPFFGFILSLGAIILGFIGKSKEPGAPKWMWLVGIIAGFAALAAGLIVIVFWIIAIIAATSTGIPTYTN